MKNIFIIAHFCDYGIENTNNRFNYIADILSKEGYNVNLITSSFSHKDKIQREKTTDDNMYKTTLIFEPSYNKNVSFKRLFYSHKIMAKNLKKYLLNNNKPDCIYCAIPSISVAKVAAEYAKKNNIPFIVDIQDLWPEAFSLVIPSRVLFNLVTKSMIEDAEFVYRSADAVISVSETYLNRVSNINNSKFKTAVYLGTDSKIFNQFYIEEENTGKNISEVWIGYCGTLGHSYDLTPIFKALSMCKDEIQYKLWIMGNGPLEKKYMQLADKLNINAVFTGKLVYPEMVALLSKCDIAINPIASGAAQSIINKHADYAMAGCAILSTQDKGEYSKLLETYNCGISCYGIEDIKNTLLLLCNDKNQRNIFKRNSKELGLKKFDRRRTYSSIVNIVNRILR